MSQQIKAMAANLYEALCVTSHDLMDVVDARMATLYRAIVAEEGSVKVASALLPSSLSLPLSNLLHQCTSKLSDISV